MCLDFSHCDPLHRVGLKNPLEKILCARRKALWDLSVTLENLEKARAKVMSLKWHQRSTRTVKIIHFYLNLPSDKGQRYSGHQTEGILGASNKE